MTTTAMTIAMAAFIRRSVPRRRVVETPAARFSQSLAGEVMHSRFGSDVQNVVGVTKPAGPAVGIEHRAVEHRRGYRARPPADPFGLVGTQVSRRTGPAAALAMPAIEIGRGPRECGDRVRRREQVVDVTVVASEVFPPEP